MKYGIIELSVVPGRAEASDKSEMTTQLLFGDLFSIIEESDKFIHIKIQYDNYDCWICKKQYLPISKTEFIEISNSPYHCVTDLVQVISYKKNFVPIVQGSSLPYYKNGEFKLDNNKVLFKGDISTPGKIGSKDKIVEDALMYLNAPYLWGGRSPLGIDCSGLTQMVYRLQGVKLPRDAYQQAEIGRTLSFIEESEPGDLAFFDNQEGKITHVGIILKNNHIIHASGRVRIDRIDQQGIFNSEIGNHTHKLRLIKSIC